MTAGVTPRLWSGAQALRAGLPGLVAGVVASPLLMITHPEIWALSVASGVLLAGVAAALLPTSEEGAPGRAMVLGALGAALWLLGDSVLLPLALGYGARWQPAALSHLLPGLAGWVTFGVGAGAMTALLQARFQNWIAGAPAPAVANAAPVTRIVILGGGFAGLTTAQHLEHRFGADPSVSITLVSDSNAVLFTPLLAEVAASSLEPTHVTSPLRTSLHRTQVVKGRATTVDFDARTVLLAGSTEGATSPEPLPFDHLVLALGAVSNYLGMAGVQAEAFDFKTLGDAIRIRNQVIDMFERADREPDPAVRRRLLTFVVAGGGFAGVELAGALNDFARGMLAFYPRVPISDLNVTLVHSRDRILPELSEPLGVYALARMRARGVVFKLNARVADARRGVVVLNPEEEIAAETLIWTAGVAPNPLLQALSLPCDRRGAVQVDGALSVPGYPGVWALGDCAAVVDGKSGAPCPPTAQFALQEAACVARNVHAAVHGRLPAPFLPQSLGVLCVVGHHTACAEIRGLRFSGLFAWLLWRSVYLIRLPGAERKLRVLVDWFTELVFPRDIVQTVDLTRSQPQ